MPNSRLIKLGGALGEGSSLYTAHGGLHVVAAEDDPDNMALLQEGLNRRMSAVAHVSFFEDGDDMARYVIDSARKGEVPDLILSDIRMPKVSGVEAIGDILRDVGDLVRDKMKVLFWSGGVNGAIAKELGDLLRTERIVLGVDSKDNLDPWGRLFKVALGGREEEAVARAEIKAETRAFFDRESLGGHLPSRFVVQEPSVLQGGLVEQSV